MRKLSLLYVDLSDGQSTSICDGLHGSTQLESLDLCQCCLPDMFPRALARSLITNTSLKSLAIKTSDTRNFLIHLSQEGFQALLVPFLEFVMPKAGAATAAHTERCAELLCTLLRRSVDCTSSGKKIQKLQYLYVSSSIWTQTICEAIQQTLFQKLPSLELDGLQSHEALCAVMRCLEPCGSRSATRKLALNGSRCSQEKNVLSGDVILPAVGAGLAAWGALENLTISYNSVTCTLAAISKFIYSLRHSTHLRSLHIMFRKILRMEPGNSRFCQCTQEQFDFGQHRIL